MFSYTTLFVIFTNNTLLSYLLFFFFFNDTATTEIYTLSLHDALPIFGHAAPEEDHGGPTAPGDRRVHHVRRELVVAEEVDDRRRFGAGGLVVRIADRPVGQPAAEHGDLAARGRRQDRASEPLLLEPEAELVEKPHRRDRRLPPALGQVVDERAQHAGLQLVVPRLGDDVVVEAVIPRHPEVGVVHVVGADAVEAVAVQLLEEVLGDVGRGRGEHVDVSALHEPGHERPEPRARQRRGVAQADEARALDHALPCLERLAELAPLEGGGAHPREQGENGLVLVTLDDGHRLADEARIVVPGALGHGVTPPGGATRATWRARARARCAETGTGSPGRSTPPGRCRRGSTP